MTKNPFLDELKLKADLISFLCTRRTRQQQQAAGQLLSLDDRLDKARIGLASACSDAVRLQYEKVVDELDKERASLQARIPEPFDANQLQGKSVEDLKRMLPLSFEVKGQEALRVYELLHNDDGIVTAGKVRYSDGAIRDASTDGLWKGPSPDARLRSRHILIYWEERLRRVQAEFEQLRAAVERDQHGNTHTQANLDKLAQLCERAKALKAVVAEAQESYDKTDPRYRTPEQQARDAEIEAASSARKQAYMDKVKQLQI